jgi:hypothetical protein
VASSGSNWTFAAGPNWDRSAGWAELTLEWVRLAKPAAIPSADPPPEFHWQFESFVGHWFRSFATVKNRSQVLNKFFVLTGATFLLAAGCTGLHCMDTKNKLPEACLAACERLGIAPAKFILAVNISRQTVSLFGDGRFVKTFACSTSRFGIGQIEGSNCTPLGLHRIAEKFGGGEPAGTVFKSRQIVGHTSQPEFADAKITTRILWLEGLEPGFNQGTNVDSHERYIYMHGTADQETIGEPASHGCIHLADADLLWLFDRVPAGTLVWIAGE